MKTIRRKVRVSEYELQRNMYEKDIKREELVKRKTSQCTQCICFFIFFVLSLSESVSVLLRAECDFKRK